MRMEIHSLDEYGDFSEEPGFTLEYKLQKAKKPTTTKQ
jgi:hypothetical protein